jgi:nucleotide-binding universal stress UspA family protein
VDGMVRMHHVRGARPLLSLWRMRILVATDGSRGGTAALRFARRLASHGRESELIVLTVARATPGGDTPEGPRKHAERILEEAARRLPRNGHRASYRVISPRGSTPVPETISREAERVKADLVVVGSEGRDTLNEWVLGGVALRLVYVSRRPVTVVRPPRRRRPV